jgi:hypothetical protein
LVPDRAGVCQCGFVTRQILYLHHFCSIAHRLFGDLVHVDTGLGKCELRLGRELYWREQSEQVNSMQGHRARLYSFHSLLHV